MRIFEKEKQSGLEKAIASNVCEIIVSEKLTNFQPLKAEAAMDDFDIYKSYSLLVSSLWNDNDDVFTKEECWAARKTPIFKRSNHEHDEKKIVGVMTNCWAVDDDYSILPDDMDMSQLPELIHLIVEDIIYKEWEDEKTKEFVYSIINGIESGEYSVSMECLFSDFDYAVITPGGSFHIIARTEETSFLSRHLRAYGGSGYYQDHKIGRLLRNIVFSGKGYTKNPANRRSMVLTPEMFEQFTTSASKGEKFELLETSSVDVSVTDLVNTNNGSELMELQEALAQIEKIQAENSALASKLDEALKTQEATKASLEEKQNAIADLESKIQEALATVASLKEAKEAAEAQLKQIQEEQVKASRLGLFTQAGFSSEEAEGYFSKFSNLSDDQFEAVASCVIEAKKLATQTAAAANESEEVEVEEVVEEVVVEEAQASQTVTPPTDKEEQTAQAGLKAWASSIFNSKKNK